MAKYTLFSNHTPCECVEVNADSMHVKDGLIILTHECGFDEEIVSIIPSTNVFAIIKEGEYDRK